MSTATSVANSGLGTQALTKPAGTETASITPGKKYSVYIPSAATFTTSFNADAGRYTIMFYAKPNPGEVLSVAGNVLTYENNTFKMTNDVGDSLSIPFDSHRAHLIVFSYSDMEAGLNIDGHEANIPAATVDTNAPLTVTLLADGGLLGDVYAAPRLINAVDLRKVIEDYNVEVPLPAETTMLSDIERDHAFVTELPDVIVSEGTSRTIMLEAADSSAFKVEYIVDGVADVYLDEDLAYSGISRPGSPEDLTVVAYSDTTVRNIRVTTYDSDAVADGEATITTDLATGSTAQTYLHDDNAGTTGETSVTINTTVNTISGWFKAQNGAPMPGVTMNNGVLTGTGLYVNGKAYSGGTVRDWYFLTKVAATTGTFTITVPVHALTLSASALNAAQIDDLYESFFGNPVYTTTAEQMSLGEQAALIISSEWSIVASG